MGNKSRKTMGPPPSYLCFTKREKPRKTNLEKEAAVAVEQKAEDFDAAIREYVRPYAKSWAEWDDIVDDHEAVNITEVCCCGSALDGSHDHNTCGEPVEIETAVPRFTPEETRANPNLREPNFRDEQGKFQLVRCFQCRPEGRGNLAPSIPRGVCYWCGARGK